MSVMKLLLGLTLFTIFAIAIVSYSVGFASDNSAVISVSDDPELSTINTSGTSGLEDFKTDADESVSLFHDSSVASGDDTVEGGGQFKTGPASIFSTTSSIVASANSQIFGGDSSEFSFILTTIFAFIGFFIGLYGWYLWKGGRPD